MAKTRANNTKCENREETETFDCGGSQTDDHELRCRLVLIGCTKYDLVIANEKAATDSHTTKFDHSNITTITIYKLYI